MQGERTFGPFSQSLGLPWGAGHHKAFKDVFPHQAGISALIDDLPHPDNRVVLAEETTDSNGIAAAKVIYSLTENTKNQMDFAWLKVQEALEAAGAKSVYRFPLANGSHLMGSARMGIDPQTSVVDANNQAHDVPNLFIVDGSSFTTGAGVNPTSTIMALALRTADKIWDKRRSWS